MHVYRWDLDKTYLETDFDSFRGLVRSATEPASEKVAVPGAPALLRGLSGLPETRIFFLSGSPTQMREVLEEKLRLDGVRFESLTLKDNLGNLRRGRISAIRGQLGYKLPHLLQARVGMARQSRECLFGDDAEVDALVYTLYAEAVSGRLRSDELVRVMRMGGAYGDRVDAAVGALASIPTSDCVDRIFIRLARRHPSTRFAPLGSRVVPVHSWWQAALVLVEDGRLPEDAAAEVLADCMRAGALDAFAVAGLTQDIVRRRGCSVSTVERIPMDSGLQQAVLGVLRRVPDPGPAQPPQGPAEDLDLGDLVRDWSQG